MTKLNDILSRVRKPGRYIGGETNSVRKKHTPEMVTVALAYPDIYEIGMSYLGLRILYHLLNEMQEVACERVFAPWVDMETELINERLPLFTLETKKEVRRFDILGFSLSYELTYTNVLNMLRLSGLPIFSKDRTDDHPLVIAGGACCYNPEPMSEFIDIFFIGDAEESLPAFINKYKEVKARNIPRDKKLELFAAMPGIYIPALYRCESEQYAIRRKPASEKVPEYIYKTNVADLDKAYYPVKQFVPLIRTIHDRMVIEIMRGCPNGCRFCQACYINRPIRTRKPATVRRLAMEAYKNTGYDQISLLSLSSVNYPYLAELIRQLTTDFSGNGVGISIPSLRIDKSFYEVPEIIAAVKKAGLTFAPETADKDLQERIGKKVDFNVLCKSASQAYDSGWNKLKLYFMVGFFNKGSKEVEEIMGWAQALADESKVLRGRPAEIKLSINPFVPKPHTPFQWASMQERELLEEKRELFFAERRRNIKVEFHDIDKSILECNLSRADKSMANVIYKAWEKGARMDAWDEGFDILRWKEAFAECGLDFEAFSSRSFSLKDPLPWDHIRVQADGDILRGEFEASGVGDR